MKTVTVDATMLRQVLVAFTGPMYLVNELHVIHDLRSKFPDRYAKEDPVGVLIKQYNEAHKEWAKTQGEKSENS